MLSGVLRDAWPVWLAVVGVAAACFFAGFFAADMAKRIQYAGVGLELLGVATVAWGLSGVRRAFGRPSIGQKFFAWTRKLWSVFRLPAPVSAVFSASGGVTVSGKARARFSAGADSPLEHRLKVLEQNVERLQDEVDANETALRRDLGVLKTSLGAEQQARDGQYRQLTSTLEEFAVGGLHLELVGLTWLVAGGLGTNIPGEIAGLLLRLTGR